MFDRTCARHCLAPLWLAAAVGLAGCAQGLDGDAGLVPLMTASEEVEIGREQHPRMLVNFGGAYDDPELDAYVGDLTRRLVARSGTPGVRKVTILNSPGVNAFALPGGYIYVTRGLLALANDEAELAMVIAHEIGHVAARHPAKRVQRVASAEVLDGMMGRIFSQSEARMVDTLGSDGYVAHYSRLQELEADALGIRLAAGAGYAPSAAVSFLKSMARDQEQRESLLTGGRRRDEARDYMSAHPPTPARLAEAKTVVSSLEPDGTRARDAYLARIDGLVYGDSREQGIVRGREFIQPELGFSFEVPPDFEIHNRANAIVALGPGRRVILFDGARVDEDVPMLQYLERAWADTLTLRDARRLEINGLEAATGWAGLGDREVRLLAVRHDGDRIYRFILLDEAGRLARLQGQTLDFVNSFRHLSAREARAVQPLRIRIHSVRPGETAAFLARQMPFSSRRLERFRVLNGLEPGEEPAVGQRVKLVAG